MYNNKVISFTGLLWDTHGNVHDYMYISSIVYMSSSGCMRTVTYETA